MANYNKVIMVGNLTRDPQLSYLPTQSQTAVVELGLAINRRWRGQDGQQRDETCFVDCRAYGKQAETINQYMAKGRPILIEGRLQYDTWEGKDGVRRSKHRVIIERFQFMGGASGQGPRKAPAGPPGPTGPTDEDNYPPPTEPPDVSGGEGTTLEQFWRKIYRFRSTTFHCNSGREHASPNLSTCQFGLWRVAEEIRSNKAAKYSWLPTTCSGPSFR